MALIERVDTTMYAFGGLRRGVVLGAGIVAVAACERHPTPDECRLGLALHNAAVLSRVLGLAIDRGARAAERAGFEQVERSYYAAPGVDPCAPVTLDTSQCELLGPALGLG